MPSAVDGAPSAIRDFLNKRGSGSFADNSFAGVMLLCALSIFGIVVFIFGILVVHSRPSLMQFGWRFFTRQAWDPVAGDFGALPFIYGTLATSLLALCMA
ncbi:MAG: phosphate ABC transporter permease subunit PstC, partial [Edaphobacter sp.]